MLWSEELPGSTLWPSHSSSHMPWPDTIAANLFTNNRQGHAMTIWLLSSNGHHGILLFDPKLLHGRSCPDKRWHGLSSDVPGLLLSTHGWISRRNWPWSLDYHLLGTFPQLKPQIHICTNPPMTCFFSVPWAHGHPGCHHRDEFDGNLWKTPLNWVMTILGTLTSHFSALTLICMYIVHCTS